MHDRRNFLTAFAGVVASLAVPRSLHARGLPFRVAEHPEPRKGYTAAKVMTAEQLGGDETLIEVFDGVRAIPQIVDGIRCTCGCADQEGMYSLLSCYEGPAAMAMWCPVCQGNGRLVARLAKQGRTLDQIRAAVDARA